MNFKDFYKEDSQVSKQYTVDDIDWKEETFDERKYDKDSNISYIKSKVINFFTKDGKYYTKPDMSGFSYWYPSDRNWHLGRHSYDYVFGTLIDNNIQRVVDVLNKVKDY